MLPRPSTADRHSRPAQQTGSNTAYPAAVAHAGPMAEASWLPQDANFHHSPYLEQQDTWRWQQQNHMRASSVPQHPAHTRGNNSLAAQTQSLPARPRSSSQALTPTIRVTTERPYTPESQAQSQDSHHTSAACLAEGLAWSPPAMDPHLSVVSG